MAGFDPGFEVAGFVDPRGATPGFTEFGFVEFGFVEFEFAAFGLVEVGLVAFGFVAEPLGLVGTKLFGA